MKAIVKKTLLICTLVLNFSFLTGQEQKSYDSIAIFQPNFNKNKFELNYPVIKSLKLKERKAKRTEHQIEEVFEDIGRFALTAFFGQYIGGPVSDTDEVNWVLKTEVQCDPINYNWELSMFTQGEHYKESFLSDEGVGLDSEKIVWWEENATGIIKQHSDTISRFILLVNPPIEEIMKKIDSVNYENQKLAIMQGLHSTFQQTSPFLWKIDYGIIGKLRDNNFAMISSYETEKVWIFMNGLVVAILQPSMKNVYSPTKKSNETQLLIDRSFDEKYRNDLVRLIFLHFYFDKSLISYFQE